MMASDPAIKSTRVADPARRIRVSCSNTIYAQLISAPMSSDPVTAAAKIRRFVEVSAPSCFARPAPLPILIPKNPSVAINPRCTGRWIRAVKGANPAVMRWNTTADVAVASVTAETNLAPSTCGFICSQTPMYETYGSTSRGGCQSPRFGIPRLEETNR